MSSPPVCFISFNNQLNFTPYPLPKDKIWGDFGAICFARDIPKLALAFKPDHCQSINIKLARLYIANKKKSSLKWGKLNGKWIGCKFCDGFRIVHDFTDWFSFVRTLNSMKLLSSIAIFLPNDLQVRQKQFDLALRGDFFSEFWRENYSRQSV